MFGEMISTGVPPVYQAETETSLLLSLSSKTCESVSRFQKIRSGSTDMTEPLV